MKKLLLAYGLTASLAAFATPAVAKEVVNVYNWSDYIESSILKDFEKETGIKVVYSVFDTNEMLKAKLLTGKSGYDVVFPTISDAAPLIKANIFQPLQKDKLPNTQHEWDFIAEKTQTFDPDNAHSVNYMWGTTGLGINAAKIKAVAPDAPLDSWAMLFDPQYAERIAKCGILVLDSPQDVVPAALNYAGKDAATADGKKLVAAKDILDPVRPYIRKIASSGNIDALANGDACLVLGYSGDMFQARDRAAEANNGVDITYVVPKEGAQMWFDQMFIPADAPNVENAHVFINYLLKPEVIAKSSNYVYYANGNKDAPAFMEAEIIEDPAIYPTEAVAEKLFVVPAYSPRTTKSLNRMWTNFKAGR